MNTVLLWHMHQPDYVNPATKTAIMPWVRLHSVKGYLDMIAAAGQVPEVKLNFNFTPILVRQIRELAEGAVTDQWEQWARTPAADLDSATRRALLEHFFKANWETMIRPYPRYAELLHLRGTGPVDEAFLAEADRLFTNRDMRDLQVWYNLAWCGFAAARHYPLVKELRRQDRDFTEEQKIELLDLHREILGGVLDRYAVAAAEGQVEITTTPFFHPIMPLVYDTDLAARCMPGRELPPRFHAPEDVRAHLRLAQEQHAEVFGAPARGLWPSEGSVAPELIPLFVEAGLDYFCTDEGNLFASLESDPGRHGHKPDHLELFQGWRIEAGGAACNALFRERPLSDFVGFNAARNTTEKAVGFLMEKLHHIAELRTEPHHAILLALDGENAWEAFRDGAEDFLTGFYRALAASADALPTRRLGEYFDAHPPQAVCRTLHTGSWINSDFDIWIGDPEENRGWDYLGRTRQRLEEAIEAGAIDDGNLDAAWHSIYAAEGSDWFWWYGPDFDNPSAPLFDELFRTHLRCVFDALGEEAPAWLDMPIRSGGVTSAYTLPDRYLRPALTGRPDGYYDWHGAGVLDVARQASAMYQADRLVSQILFGFDRKNFYLRVDAPREAPEVVAVFVEPRAATLSLKPVGKANNVAAKLEVEGGDGAPVTAAWDECLMASLPMADLGWDRTPGQAAFYVSVRENGVQRERHPETGVITFPLPDEEFGARQWFV